MGSAQNEKKEKTKKLDKKEYRAQQEKKEWLEKGALERIKKLMGVATRVRQDQMRDILHLDAATFNDKILDWAAEFKFKIDGDFVVIEGGDVTGFISKLDAEFADWGKKAESKAGKL